MTLIRGDLQVRRSLLDQLQHAAQHTDDGPERPVLVLEDRQLNRCGGFVGLLAGEGGFEPPSLDILQLEAQWKALYGSAPPRRLGRDLLRRAVAFGLA
jgi:hypothetical protein